MSKEKIESPIDIPLSCSLFLEPALGHFKPFVAKTSKETKDFVHQWNIALLDVIKNKNINQLGTVGQRIIKGMDYSPDFLKKCVSAPLARDIPSWALHYTIRFTESLRFLSQKQQNIKEVRFVDYGCGLSPVAIIAKNEYGMKDTYCVETCPQIIELYITTANKLGLQAPTFIEENQIKIMAQTKLLNTIVSMGVFPHMSTDDQLKHFMVLYKNIPNFLIEVKYSPDPSEPVKNSFTLENLQKIKLTIENVDSLETTIFRNSMRYLSVFRKTLPLERKFIENCRSLFLSR